MKKYEVFWKNDVIASSPKEAAKIACRNLRDVMPSDYTVLETEDYIFYNVNLEAEEGEQASMIVVIGRDL